MTALIHQLPASEYPWRYAVEFDYCAEMVDGIKTKIPSRLRTWKPTLRQWWFKSDAILVVCTLAQKHCSGYTHMGESPTGAAIVTNASAYAMLHLLPTAPPEVVTAAYRALAKKAHPDVGGSTQTMQTINTAYALIQRDYA